MLDTGETAAGTRDPRLPNFLELDSDTIADRELNDAIRAQVKMERIRFVFPEGLAAPSLFEECRALCDLDNFDIMYDLTMQYLTGKSLQIAVINDDGSQSLLGEMYVQHKNSDLRQMDCVTKFPFIVVWLTEFMAGYLSKKFPLPLTALAAKTA